MHEREMQAHKDGWDGGHVVELNADYMLGQALYTLCLASGSALNLVCSAQPT